LFPTKIDNYIIKRFLGGFVYTLLLIVSVALTIDFGEKVDKYILYKLKASYVFYEYYLPFIPYIIVLLGPYFVFITVIFFTSQLASKSEIIAMFNSGMSFKRFLVPYIFVATLIACFIWYANNYLVPNTNKRRLAFENKYIANQRMISSDHIHRRLNDSTFIYMRVYDNNLKEAYSFSMETIKNKKLVRKLMSEKAKYDTLTQTWTAYNLFERHFDDSAKESIVTMPEKRLDIKIDPVQFVKRWTYREEMNRDELSEKINELKEQGSDTYKEFQFELYRRTSACFGIIILTIIGVVISSKKIRGGMGIHLMIGVTMSSIYEFIIKFTESFAIKAHLPSLMAVWIPNILFLMIAMVLMKKYQE
jgi:lipopolysaccharide export system permease protein